MPSLTNQMQRVDEVSLFTFGMVIMLVGLGWRLQGLLKLKTPSQIRTWLIALISYCFAIAIILWAITTWGQSITEGQLQAFLNLLSLLPKTLSIAGVIGAVLLFIPVKSETTKPGTKSRAKR